MNDYEKMARRQGWGPAEEAAARTAWNAALVATQCKVANSIMPIDQKNKVTVLINSLVTES